MFIVYLVTNNINGKRYVGFTSHPLEVRWYFHVKSAMGNKKTRKPTHFHAAIRKYGPENFSMVPLEIGENNDYGSEIAEPLYIQSLKPEYNKTVGGKGNRKLVVSEATKLHLSKYNKRYYKTNKGKQHLQNFQNGAMHPETRQRIAYTQSNNWMMTSPNNEIFYIRNLSEFCRKHGLRQGCLSLIAQKKRGQHLGWKACKV